MGIMVWTGFISLRIQTSGGLVNTMILWVP